MADPYKDPDELVELRNRVKSINRALHDINVVAANAKRIAPLLKQYFDSITLGTGRISKDLIGIKHVLRSITETNCDGVDLSGIDLLDLPKYPL